MSATNAVKAELTAGLALVATVALVAGIAGGMRDPAAGVPVGFSAIPGEQSPILMPEVVVTAEPPIPMMPEVLISAEPLFPVLPEVLVTAPRVSPSGPAPRISGRTDASAPGLGGRPFSGRQTEAIGHGVGMPRRSPAAARPAVN